MFYKTVLQLLDCLLDLGIGHIFFVFSNHYSRCLELIKNQFIVWKVSVFGVFLVHIFPHLLWIWGDMSISPYSVQMRMNADQKKSKYKHFLSSDWTSVHWTTRKLTDFYLMRIMGGCLMGSFMYFRLIHICIPFFKVWINGLNLIIWQTNDHKVKFCKNISVLKTYC